MAKNPPGKPYGNVAYADPGYQSDGKSRYPIDTEDHVRAAYSYISQSDNASKYSPEQVAKIKARIKAAGKKYGITFEDQGPRYYDDEAIVVRSTRTTDVPVLQLMREGIECRFNPNVVEMRTNGSGGPRIGGYAAVFDKPSRNLGGFIERVDTGFFNESRAANWPDVMARFNHSDMALLGTTGSGTLQLRIDPTGLDYEVEPPKGMAHVTELVARGDIRKSSFAFVVAPGGDDWAMSEQGYPMRSLISGKLIDVAPVTSPAYSETTSGLRSLAQVMDADFEEVRSAAEDDNLRRFFVRSDRSAPAAAKPKRHDFGPAAMASLLNRKQDPSSS